VPSEKACSRGVWFAVLVSLLVPLFSERQGLTSFTRHIHRADFHRGLLKCATDVGCQIHLDSKVEDVEPEVPALVTTGGTRFTADLIVASDGLHSKCRHIVVGQPSKPIPTGQMVYRVTVPANRLVGIPELDEIRTVPRNNHWIGPHGTILSYLLEGVKETLVNLVFTSVTGLQSSKPRD